MAQVDPPRVTDALMAIVARSGLYWVTVIVASIAYWQIAPDGEANWLVPVTFALGFWLLLFGLKDKADFRAAERLHRGEAPRNGQWCAVGGKAVAMRPEGSGESDILAARFQSFDRMSGLKSGRSHLRLSFDAYYLRPTGIDTGTRIVALRGFPDLIHTDQKPLDNDTLVRAKSSAHMVSRFMPPPILRECTISGPLTEIEACFQYPHPEQSGGGKLDSYTLSVGEEVCVFGLWRDGALVKSYRRARGLPVYKGSVAEVLERLREDSKGFTIFGAIVLAISASLALWSLI